MNHLLDVSQLSPHEIMSLINRAMHFKRNSNYPSYPKGSLVNLFYENSTRTRVSFELAAKRLSIPVVNFDVEHSSESKGEIIDDTIRTIAAMGVQLMVIRHKQEGLPQVMAEICGGTLSVINAGDGTRAHPSQALLDLMTISENKVSIHALKIAIVGDLRHSRVANSLQSICALMGVGELILVAPPIWKPTTVHYGTVTSSLQEGIEAADVIICLRVQQERLNAAEHLDLASYRRDYAITADRLRSAKPDVMVMHPGPINRGVEIDSEVADGPRSFVLQQVSNGVFMRMAIIEALIHRHL